MENIYTRSQKFFKACKKKTKNKKKKTKKKTKKKNSWYSINVRRQSARIVVDPIMVDNFASFF